MPSYYFLFYNTYSQKLKNLFYNEIKEGIFNSGKTQIRYSLFFSINAFLFVKSLVIYAP